MSCSTCQMNIEGYENFPWMSEQAQPKQAEAPAPEKTKCAKEIMSNCLYTTQGMYLCQKEIPEAKNEVPNEEMARYAFFSDKGVAKTASPWNTTN